MNALRFDRDIRSKEPDATAHRKARSGEGRLVAVTARRRLESSLTGKPPYTGNSVGELLLKHARGDVPRLPSRLAPYQELTERLLGKLPDERFASAAEMLRYVEGRFGKAA